MGSIFSSFSKALISTLILLAMVLVVTPKAFSDQGLGILYDTLIRNYESKVKICHSKLDVAACKEAIANLNQAIEVVEKKKEGNDSLVLHNLLRLGKVQSILALEEPKLRDKGVAMFETYNRAKGILDSSESGDIREMLEVQVIIGLAGYSKEERHIGKEVFNLLNKVDNAQPGLSMLYFECASQLSGEGNHLLALESINRSIATCEFPCGDMGLAYYLAKVKILRALGRFRDAA